MSNQLDIFIVSDSVGETGEYMLHAVLSQFPNITDDEINIVKYTFIDTIEKLEPVLTLAKTKNAIVITTLVCPELNQYGQMFKEKENLTVIDYMSPLMKEIENHSGKSAVLESGAVRRLDHAYFRRIEAMEFAVKYDDGKNFEGIEEADAIIIGVSRTSKTPLTMFLANKGYKIANIPLVHEVNLPKEIYEFNHLPIFGLTASPEYILNIRKKRMEVLGLSDSTKYVSLSKIKEELSYAEEIFRQVNATVISTEFRSIEESAHYIEKHLKYYVDF